MKQVKLVLTIDGPAHAGKGTCSRIVAEALGFTHIDSGAYYRAVGLLSLEAGKMKEEYILNVVGILDITRQLDISFRDGKVFIHGADRTSDVRSDKCATLAALVAQREDARHEVNCLILRAIQSSVGVVIDGRSGGAEFPNSRKYFLTATPEERARRRHKQALGEGRSATFEEILAATLARDTTDRKRHIAPLVPHRKALVIDTTGISAHAVALKVVSDYMREIADAEKYLKYLEGRCIEFLQS
jgi:CMP/dCMP kinase